MKTLHYSKYRCVGRKDSLYCFVSIRKRFDPEILWLTKAKMIKEDGTFTYFDPIAASNIANHPIDVTYEGIDSDGESYRINIEVDSKVTYHWRNQSAVCVNQPVCEGRTPKRRIVRYANLIKKHHVDKQQVMVN